MSIILTEKKAIKKGKPYIYANKGEQVTIISVHDNVFIVENEKGERFSIKKEFVKQ